jgi:hypothetical protein
MSKSIFLILITLGFATLLGSCAPHYTYTLPTGRSSWVAGHWFRGQYIPAHVSGTEWIPPYYTSEGFWVPGHWV